MGKTENFDKAGKYHLEQQVRTRDRPVVEGKAVTVAGGRQAVAQPVLADLKIPVGIVGNEVRLRREQENGKSE